MILDDGMFHRVPIWNIVVFFALWNANQVVLSITVSGFISSSGLATAVGFTLAMIFSQFFTMVNMYIFPYPTKLPFYYKLFPLSVLSRVIIFMNIKGAGPVTPAEVADNTENLIYLAIDVIIYGLLGLIINEPRIRDWFKKIFGLINRPDFNAYDEEKDKLHDSAKLEGHLLDSMKEDEKKAHIIVCKNLKKFYVKNDRFFPALKGLALRIEKNEIFGLLGPNGAGKTTLISILTNFIKSDQGEVYINGELLASRNSDEKISLCPQFDIQWSILSIYEHLKIFGLLRGLSGAKLEEQIIEILKKVSLYQERHQIVQTLSGGMRRRCSLAMSLIGNVTIVFLDEPSTGLDPKKRREFWNMILGELIRLQIQQNFYHQYSFDGRGRVLI